MTDKVISYPFGKMDIQNVDYASTIDLTVKNQKTLVEVGQMTGNVTLNVTPDDLDAGAELIVKLESDSSARDVTLNTGFLGTTISGTASKTKYAYFDFDGTNFVHIATQQVN